MKAILGNFKKISETEFRLKKDLQFADITVDESHEIQTVDYGDRQDIKIDDILTYNECDYEIKSINLDHSNYISVEVKLVAKPYVEVSKPKFKARKMTPVKRKPKSIPLKIIEPIQEKQAVLEPVQVISPEATEFIKVSQPEPHDIIENVVATPIIPKKKSILKRFISYLGNKLTSYSDS